MRRTFTLAAGAALVAAISLPITLHAHRQWLFPSATVLSGSDPWVTVDAAISNDLFYFEHFPMRLDNLVVTAPDGTSAKAENASTGRYRSTFDVHLTQKGTYKIAVANNQVAASYTENGQPKQWRGTPDAFAKEVPAGAADLKVSRTSGRVEVFVTSGSPSDTVLKTTGVGLELAPVTHPNDLVAGEAATFAFVLDGKPAANLAVTLIPGGIRYRDTLGEIKATTDKDGKVTVTLPEPGMYWLNASYSEGGPTRQGPPSAPSPDGEPQDRQRGGPSLTEQAAPQQPPTAGPRAQGGPGGPGRMGPGNRPIVPGRRASYVATLEVLPQ
ncbi:MAG TPA: DUF4198 domain-containing protein [Luteitalea sp.]|nr:DUF4198 domain-containing protein [Luteitalea sp.]